MHHNDFKPAHRTWDLFSLLLMALLFVASSQLALAQVSASISGKIEDPSGAAIPGAAVTVTSLETGATRTATADEGGNYRVLSLPVGRYEARVEKEGFKAAVQTGINLVVGQQAVVNLRLELGATQQEVTVTAEAPLVNTTTASVSGLVGENQVKDLPLNGRSFDNLITLTAGAIKFTALTQAGGPSGNVGNFFSVAGRQAGENLFLLNGVEYTGTSQTVSLPAGVSGQMLGIDAVREFNVVSDTYAAQYGKRAGAQINIVSQSGTNRFHGTLFEFLRNSALDARNFFDQGMIHPFKRNQFGGSAGGPIRKDKTFVFGSYEGFRQRLGISGVTFVPDLNARKGLLPDAQGVPTPVAGLNQGMLPFMAFWPEPNGPNLGQGIAVAFSSPKQSIREDFGTVRLDHTFSEKDTLSSAYTIDDGYNLTPQPDPVFGVVTSVRNQILSLQETHIFSPNVINTLTAGFSRVGFFYNPVPSVSLPPSLSFVAGGPPGNIIIGGGVAGGGTTSSITAAGGSAASLLINHKTLFTYAEGLEVIKGKHQISAGVHFERLRSNEIGTFRMYGQGTFGSLQSFLQGTVTNFQVVINPTPHAWRQLEGSWYLQDAIQVLPNLNLRLGLRHEFTNGWNEATGRSANFLYDSNGVLLTNPLVGNSPLTENNAKWLFSPRVGLAWDPFGKGKTSIRAGFGTYYDLQDAISFPLAVVPPFNGGVAFAGVPFLPLLPIVPTTPVPPPCGPDVPKPCTTYAPQGVQPNMKTPTVEEWNFTIEQQITPNSNFRIAYIGSHGFHDLVSLDANTIHPQSCSSPSGCTSGGIGSARGTVPQGAQYIPVGTRPNPFLANSLFWNSEGNASYNALQVEITKRMSHGIQLRGNYTWSKSLDTLGARSSTDSINQPSLVWNSYDMRPNWGPSAHDFKHQASISGAYELPFGHDRFWLNGVSGIADKLAGGWQLNWIASLVSGFPLTPLVGTNQSGDGNSRAPDRPSMNPAFSGPVVVGNPNQWFNPNAFILPVPGTYGNAGRGILRGPGLGELDLSLFKTTSLGEKVKLQFRAEFFNILNRTNFGVPNDTVFASGSISPSAGRITFTATTSRQIQFGLKLSF